MFCFVSFVSFLEKAEMNGDGPNNAPPQSLVSSREIKLLNRNEAARLSGFFYSISECG